MAQQRGFDFRAAVDGIAPIGEQSDLLLDLFDTERQRALRGHIKKKQQEKPRETRYFKG
jgi:hypothetical protein